MKLISFSVTNYRSITVAHKIPLQNLTVLVGKNNEGKSNLLNALNVAMTALLVHARESDGYFAMQRNNYNWERDFPISLRGRKKGLESIIGLDFCLDDKEKPQFRSETGIHGNDIIPIRIHFAKDNKFKIEVPKRGTSTYTKKSTQVADFISKRIYFNYIQTNRTEDTAFDVLKSVIAGEIDSIEKNLKGDEKREFVQAKKRIREIQEKQLNAISEKLVSPMKAFLPQLNEIKIKIDEKENERYLFRSSLDVIVDDGTPTSINYKGDGIKSLITLAILKDRKRMNAASIIAIEEPESHLHSGAIHSLIDVIHNIAENNQVIITTHNPLFVQQNNLKSNIIVNNGTAQPAKSISDIRNILGVLSSDNLKNSNNVLLVEGEDDKISLLKILPFYSEKIKNSLKTNNLVIHVMGGAGNLGHDITDLKNSLCKYVILLDNDSAGIESEKKAIEAGLIKENEAKFTICNGSPESEFEDCLNPALYKQKIKDNYNVDIDMPHFKGNEKWSTRMKKAFSAYGTRWDEQTEKKVKIFVAESIPNEIKNIDEVLIEQKASFINGVVLAIENMIK